MSLDPYAPCPCGSGKKLKWCCQPIAAAVNHAAELLANGQQDAAFRAIDQLCEQHAGNPEVWGQKARFLATAGRSDEAEQALQKAFDLNPNYPFGLYLQASFRFEEGEVPGALLLARRAADAYDPAARSQLASVYWIIYQAEEALRRPVAARAALRVVLRCEPGAEEVRQTFDHYFGPDGVLPAAARREYALLAPPPGAGPRRAAWDQALAAAGGRLGDVARTFEALAKEEPDVAAAWFNLALGKAWLGDNQAALAAIDRYLDLEADEARATTAATLAEVLRTAAGLEDECDYHEYAFAHQIRNPAPVQALVDEWIQGRRLIPMQTPQEGVFFALILELSQAGLVTVGRPAADAGRLAGYLTIYGDLFQVSSPAREAFERLRDEVRQRFQLGLGELRERRGPCRYADVVAEALLFPVANVADQAQAEARVLEHAGRFFEDTWVHRPRRSLGNVAPVDAASSPRLRRKLRGVIQFMQDCAEQGALAKYDFDRLRRKLGLLDVPAAPAGTVPADIPALGAAELAALPVASLSDDQLEQAYQTAHRLDAGELAAHFAQALVGRPAVPGKTDRFGWFSFLINKAQKEGDHAAALDLVNEGEKFDCEQNEGKRRNDYELRRAQVHAKRGEADAAEEVFRRLVERVPGNMKFRAQAAEAMLSLKQGGKALRFAEEGLAQARKQNDRDSEQHLMELAAAARKQGG